MKRNISFYFIFLISALLLRCSVIHSEKINEVSFSVVGDIMQHDLQLKSAWNSKCKCYEYMPVFAPVKHLLERPDLTIGNLETTLPGDPKKFSGYPAFGSPDELAKALKENGFDILTTANNHAMDKGASGVRRTIEVLDREGIQHLGTYASEELRKQNRALLVEKNGIRMAFLNYTYGTNGIAVPPGIAVNLIDKKIIQEDLEHVRISKPDAVIVLYHFGGEYLRLPDQFQKDMTEFAFQNGADIVLGGHPHVLQPFTVKKVKDKYGDEKERLVIYSLGNFISNQQRRFTDGGIIFSFNLIKSKETSVQITNIHYEPVWVYLERTPKKIQYYILPVAEYLDRNAAKDIKLTDFAYTRMVRFYRDTSEHLAESIKEIAAK